MKRTGEYRGVVLDNIDPVKLAEGFGVEGMHATDESNIADAIEHGLKTVELEKRPFLLNVHLPIGLPGGGRPGVPYSLKDDFDLIPRTIPTSRIVNPETWRNVAEHKS